MVLAKMPAQDILNELRMTPMPRAIQTVWKCGSPQSIISPRTPIGTGYLRPLFTALSPAVDAILNLGANVDCITVVRQMKENDFSVKYMHGWKGIWVGAYLG
jgi:hypothetical protein